MGVLTTKRWSVLATCMVLSASGWSVFADNEMPAERTQGSVSYVSGGIGTEQQDAMKQAAPSYPLEVQFVVSGNADAPSGRLYTASVAVTIRDGTGNTLLETKSDGPFLLARLPDGDYTITAEAGGRTETRRVHVDQGRHRQVFFEWNG